MSVILVLCNTSIIRVILPMNKKYTIYNVIDMTYLGEIRQMFHDDEFNRIFKQMAGSFVILDDVFEML